MMKYRLLPYKAGSASAANIARSLGMLRVSLTSSRIRNVNNLLVINWGNGSNVPDNLSGARFLNPPRNVAKASNKLEAFRAMEQGRVPIPDYTTSRDTVREWLMSGATVVVRHKLTGNSGEGIELIQGEDTVIPNAPLYTKYVKKVNEFRVHVGYKPTGVLEVLDVQRKARITEMPDEQINWQIRNRNNGFIFSRNGNIRPEASVIQAAKDAVMSLELDFGAVDIGWNSHTNSPTVYEVNTACGVEGTTLENYTNYFNEWKNHYDEA